jgi:alpha-galactosidase
MTNFEILRAPDRVDVFTGEDRAPAERRGDAWVKEDVQVVARLKDARLGVDVTAERSSLDRVRLYWQSTVPAGLRFLGDHWERGYGDLEWRGLVPERVMPWYFLCADGALTHGYGVKTAPGAFCFWTVDGNGVSLWLDVRSGGQGVKLSGRTLHAAEIVARPGREGETPFAAACAFCALLCDHPRSTADPVYGSNNWYYAYGHSSHEEILDDTRLLVSLAPDVDNRPYMVIDAGWQASDQGGDYAAAAANLWGQGNDRFPDMPGLAAAMRDLGARPGIWIRPLLATRDSAESMLLPEARAMDDSARRRILDPSLPETLARVKADFARLRDWGYALIKHDWTTCDILGRWGFQMGAELTYNGWCFADRGRTTAEITLDLFRAIREGAGGAVVIGCNVVGHLSAGLFELQRTGDDTSGRDWERTRKMGVNTLAFRMPQHGAFFQSDADCVGLTEQVPWTLNRQWLELLARSGTPLFVSADPAAVGPEQARAMCAAYAAAARPQARGEPLDWLDSTCPRTWRLGEQRVRFDWYSECGVYLT